MSTSYHTTNSLLDAKMQSEGIDVFSCFRAQEKRPGEQNAAARLKHMTRWMNANVSASMKQGQPSHSQYICPQG